MAAVADIEITAVGHERSAQSAAVDDETRKRDFRLLRGGFTASTLGNRISTIAYPLLVLAITNSPADAGWTGFAAVAPSIMLYLPAGLLVDRTASRRMMLVSESGRGIVIAAVVAALVLGHPHPWEVVIAAAAEQSLRVFTELAERRLTSSLLERDHEAAGLASSETWGHTAVLIGRPLGGLLFGLRNVFPFVADFVSVWISVLTVLPIRSGRFRDGPGAGQPGRADRLRSRLAWSDLAEAWQWWRANPFAELAVPITAGTTFIGQALIMVFLIGAQSRHQSSLGVGLVLGASGVGGAVGSAGASWFFSRFRYALLHRQLWVWTGALAMLWSTGGHSLTAMALTMGTFGFSGALGNVAVDTYLVRTSGQRFARLVSIDRITSLIALALGPLVGGIAMQAYGLRDTIMLLFFMTFVLAAAAYSEPAMRSCNDGYRLDRVRWTDDQLSRVIHAPAQRPAKLHQARPLRRNRLSANRRPIHDGGTLRRPS